MNTDEQTEIRNHQLIHHHDSPPTTTINEPWFTMIQFTNVHHQRSSLPGGCGCPYNSPVDMSCRRTPMRLMGAENLRRERRERLADDHRGCPRWGTVGEWWQKWWLILADTGWYLAEMGWYWLIFGWYWLILADIGWHWLGYMMLKRWFCMVVGWLNDG